MEALNLSEKEGKKENVYTTAVEMGEEMVRTVKDGRIKTVRDKTSEERKGAGGILIAREMGGSP